MLRILNIIKKSTRNIYANDDRNGLGNKINLLPESGMYFAPRWSPNTVQLIDHKISDFNYSTTNFVH